LCRHQGGSRYDDAKQHDQSDQHSAHEPLHDRASSRRPLLPGAATGANYRPFRGGCQASHARPPTMAASGHVRRL
jgi:hypothetical protein